MGGGERAGAGRFTLDTNVLVYCVDSAAGPRRELARQVVEAAVRRDCHLTLQAVSRPSRTWGAYAAGRNGRRAHRSAAT
jgi:hypothetical protein